MSYKNVFGGGTVGTVTNANVNYEGADALVVYGGPSEGGTTLTSNVNLKSGTAPNVFGGGKSGTKCSGMHRDKRNTSSASNTYPIAHKPPSSRIVPDSG